MGCVFAGKLFHDGFRFLSLLITRDLNKKDRLEL